MIKAIPKEYWACKSTDTKPTEHVPDNQCLYEKDTGYTYIFDKEEKKWYKM